MPKEIIRTDKAPAPYGAYSQAVKAGGFVFVSAQGPTDPATKQMSGESIQDQTRQCFANIDAILRAAGSSLDKVVSTTFTLGEIQDFAGMNEEWARAFPTDPPAREGSVMPIPVKGLKIAISVIAGA
jgi:2-iminobutanoate/2-iminopropanoate deaminase